MFGRSRAVQLAFAGAIGGVCGLFLYTELFNAPSLYVRDALAGMAIGGTLGFLLNAAEPFRDRAWLKLGREAGWAALFGAAGGALGLVVGEAILGGFRGGLAGRTVSWAILGLSVGASQGVAGRSAQRARHGALGGLIGGAAGGFLFELLREKLGPERYDLSQGLGMALLGAGLGAALALVEQALTRAWVVVQNGRQEGRSFPLDRPAVRIGRDEHTDIGLFGDMSVARDHAEIRREDGHYRLYPRGQAGTTAINGKPVAAPVPLRDGDLIDLGATKLRFRSREAPAA